MRYKIRKLRFLIYERLFRLDYTEILPKIGYLCEKIPDNHGGWYKFQVKTSLSCFGFFPDDDEKFYRVALLSNFSTVEKSLGWFIYYVLRESPPKKDTK